MSRCTTSAAILLGVGLLSLAAAPVSAAVHLVRPDGSGDFPSIQQAIDGAAAGDTLELSSGVFQGAENRDLAFGGKALLVRSVALDPDSCIVDCQSLGRAIQFAAGDTAVVVEGVAFVNGSVSGADVGGSLAIGAGASPTFLDCDFLGNVSAAEGGAIHVSGGARPSFTRCVIAGNGAADGAGLFVADSSRVSILSSTISGNAATDQGGGLFAASDSLLTLERSIVWGNCATAEGPELFATGNADLAFICSDVDSAGVEGTGSIDYDANTIFVDPIFCGAVDCSSAPFTNGVYAVRADSPVLAGNSPCGLLIGARDVSCAVPTGACCFTDGTCLVQTAADCATAGGTYQGDDTVCEPNPCPQPTGACCFADGSCLVETAADCATAGGTYQGNDTVCTPNPCPQPTGACCFADGSCLVETEGDCATAGGTYQGNDTVCTPNPCPQPTGACCFADGSCLVETEADCATAGGTYQGDDTVCEPNPCPQPTGACCFADGSCLVETAADCATAGGTYQGDDTVCSPNPCPQPTGACCFADGSCLVETAADCATAGGTYQGDDTVCTPNPCPQPTGACCFADGSCVVETAADCATVGGTYQGNDTVCDPNPCPQPTGACCFADGSCLVETAADCATAGGTYQGDDTVCTPNPCPQPTGACCFADGSCLVETEADCATAGGTYQGDDTVCTPNPCPQPTGACCFADGSCLVETAADCATAGGTYQGDDTVCTPNPCPQPTGACCFTDGSCLVETAADCATAGGTYQGDDTVCTPNPCPQPTGACCFADGSCLVETEADCATAGGTYQGNDTVCEPNPCPQPTGACCFADGSCLVDFEVECTLAGGTYQGYDTVCAPNPCPPLLVLADGTGDYPTIQAAIDAAGPSANIELATGVFTGVGNRDILFRGKALTLRSASGDPDSTVIDCELSGRGFYFRDGEDTTTVVRGIGIVNGTVTGSARGGGIAMIASSPRLESCSVRGSSSDANGGGIYLLNASPVLEGCLLAGNAASHGGGLFAEGLSRPSLLGCTISGNDALAYGGGIYTSSPDTVRLERSILYGNCAALGGAEARLDDAILVSLCSLADSAEVDGTGLELWSPQDLFTNPRFCAPGACEDAPATTGDYTVRAGAPVLAEESPCGLQIGALGEGCASFPIGACCLDAGGCALLEEVICVEEEGTYQGDGTSCEPDPCPTGGACCLDDGSCVIRTPAACASLGGSYLGDETVCSPESCAIVVLPDGSGDYPTIQAAIDAAAGGAIVELANGTFSGPGNRGIRFRGKAVTVRSASGDPDSCIVDPAGLDRGFYFDQGETAASVLEGIGIHNGAVTGSGRGGGIACVLDASPTLRNLSIRGCSSAAQGGAFYASSGTVVMEGCRLTGNTALDGAGVFLEGTASLQLDGCTVAGNRADGLGGGLYAGGGGATLGRSIVWGNCASEGAELYLASPGLAADFTCSSVDSSRIEGDGFLSFDANTIFEDPLFCAYLPCSAAPTTAGDHALSLLSPCLGAASPCSLTIGAEGEGCAPIPTGACCLPNGDCRVYSQAICENAGGGYSGDGVPCDPSPCAVTGACCLPDGSCDLLLETACATANGTFRGAGTFCEADSCAALVVLPDGSGDFATIQDAIDFAGPGATIELGDGVFRGSGNKDLRFYGKPLRLRSASGDPDSCRIDCEGSGRGLYFRDGEGPETIVEGIGIVAGSLTGTARGAGVASVNASPTLRRLAITGCAAEGNGGGIYALGGAPTLESCTIARNRAARGGGVFAEGDADLSLTRTILHGNCATFDAGFGNPEDEAVASTVGSALRFACAAVDSNGVSGAGTIEYDANTVFDSPIFCAALPCDEAPTAGGDYSLNVLSPCVPESSPCGELIGAFAAACADSVGACCLDDVCFVTNAVACADEAGIYQGNGSTCDPNPCPQQGACCLPDESCVLLTKLTCYDAGGTFLGEDIDCPPDGCSFNAGGVLIVHAEPGLSYENGTAYCDTTSLASCGEAVISVAGADTVVFHVIAALPDDGGSRLTGVTFGIDYDPTKLALLDRGACGDFELADTAWPDPGTGTAVTWTTPQLDILVEVYWFAVLVLEPGPTEFRLIAHPTQGAFFADDEIPPTLDRIACLGTLGFDAPGTECCATVDAPLETALPTELRFRSIHPNPMHRSAEIVFDLPETGRVDLSVFDAAGRRLAQLIDEERAAGTHRVVWSARAATQGAPASDVGSGVYFVRLQALGRDEIRKIVVLE